MLFLPLQLLSLLSPFWGTTTCSASEQSTLFTQLSCIEIQFCIHEAVKICSPQPAFAGMQAKILCTSTRRSVRSSALDWRLWRLGCSHSHGSAQQVYPPKSNHVAAYDTIISTAGQWLILTVLRHASGQSPHIQAFMFSCMEMLKTAVHLKGTSLNQMVVRLNFIFHSDKVHDWSEGQNMIAQKAWNVLWVYWLLPCRNVYRGSAKMYDLDSKSLHLAKSIHVSLQSQNWTDVLLVAYQRALRLCLDGMPWP